jgi:hypothetical protein
MAHSQTTDCVLMIRPVSFRMNKETAVDNHFQQDSGLNVDVNELAQKEFDNLVSALQDNGVHVIVVNDTAQPETPDALFPNNWISFHSNKIVCLYPMFADNRRKERRDDVFKTIKDEFNFELEGIFDFTEFEQHDKFLEGTGSMVLDRTNRTCYAALSGRTDEKAVAHFCAEIGYTPILFKAYHSVNGQQHLIYHTNVMMSVGNGFAVVCSESITDLVERELVVSTLKSNGHLVVDLSLEQIDNFAGNILELLTSTGESIIVMSARAKESLTVLQVSELEAFGKLIYVDLQTIENYGGGSARCMIAEIFLPRLQNETN